MAIRRIELLKWIVASSAAMISPTYPRGYATIPAVQLAGATELHEDGNIVAYFDSKDAQGSFPAVVSEQGMEAAKAEAPLANVGNIPGAAPAGQPAGAATSVLPFTVEIDDNIPMPEVKRGFGRGATEGGTAIDKFGFASLKVGQSIHIPASMAKDAETPVHRAFSSVVSQANTKLHPMHYVIREVGADDPKGAGARIFRTEDTQGERVKRQRKSSKVADAMAAANPALGAGFQGQGPGFAPAPGFDSGAGGFGFQAPETGFTPPPAPAGFGAPPATAPAPAEAPAGFGGGFTPPPGFTPG